MYARSPALPELVFSSYSQISVVNEQFSSNSIYSLGIRWSIKYEIEQFTYIQS